MVHRDVKNDEGPYCQVEIIQDERRNRNDSPRSSGVFLVQQHYKRDEYTDNHDHLHTSTYISNGFIGFFIRDPWRCWRLFVLLASGFGCRCAGR